MTNEEKCWKIIKDMKVSGPWQEHMVHTAMMRLLEDEKTSGNSDTMNWKDITKEQPEDDQRVLTWNEYYKECRIQVYNETCECWDESDGDDFEYKLTDDAIRYWMTMPNAPVYGNID